MNRVLITGIDSFTGVHLSKYLEKAGYDIYGTSLTKSDTKNLSVILLQKVIYLKCWAKLSLII